MLSLHTITLELLRPGPAHNQLLSPLTSYLALCDGRGAVTLHVPFEHREILRQRQALSYGMPAPQRRAQLQQTADTVGQGVLGAIPTLSAALAETQFGQDRLIHLRLVLSAAELALLPFELATAPPGFPGEAKPLLLQASAPITLTREVRNATVSQKSWARPPRVLLCAASLPGMAPVPLREHLQCLRRALAPWASSGTEGDGALDQVLTVLPRATLAAIRDACAQADYTHVHLLCHGTSYGDGIDDKFGIALFGPDGGLDRVGGHRLADALRTQRRGGQGFASPNVVTVCACDSGNVKDVVSPGASLAHALHEAGIPWVVASQFPLSMHGSEILCRLFYERVLVGEDPRVVLHHLRQVLRAECSDNHDWASVVAYAAVPADFADQVREFRKGQCHRAIDLAFRKVDRLSEKKGARIGAAARREQHEKTGAILREVDEHLVQLEGTLPDGDGPQEREKRLHFLCQKGRTEKRRAYALYQQKNQAFSAALGLARRHYVEAAALQVSWHWPLTQILSIDALLSDELPEEFQRYLSVARLSAEMDLQSASEETRAWAHASLVELHLLALRGQKYDAADAAAAEEHAALLRSLAGLSAQQVERTYGQIERYLHWGKPARDGRFVRAVRRALQALLR